MTKYRFSGRVASFFRATGNAWVEPNVMADTTGATPKLARKELESLVDFGHVERRGKRGSLEYRWNPDTLFATDRKGHYERIHSEP